MFTIFQHFYESFPGQANGRIRQIDSDQQQWKNNFSLSMLEKWKIYNFRLIDRPKQLAMVPSFLFFYSTLERLHIRERITWLFSTGPRRKETTWHRTTWYRPRDTDSRGIVPRGIDLVTQNHVASYHVVQTSWHRITWHRTTWYRPRDTESRGKVPRGIGPRDTESRGIRPCGTDTHVCKRKSQTLLD